MDNRLYSFYTHPDAKKCKNDHLLSLAENCAVLEDRVLSIMESLPFEQQQTIQAYIDFRNDLEVESVKAAMRLHMYLSNLSK